MLGRSSTSLRTRNTETILAVSETRRRLATTSFRPGGAGPLYWSTYGYENSKNVLIPEDVWKANVDWVATTFRDYGYKMVCTDGWIDHTQKITPHGYILSQADDWEHDWAWWAKYLKGKGLELGVYYNPLWATRSAVTNPSVTVVGRPDIKVGDIVNPGDYFDGGGLLQWVDTTRDGAEEYVKGYVAYFRDLGAMFLRIDFLAWYETGTTRAAARPGGAHGRDSYLQALEWMSDAAGDMQLSLVMPNLFDHGSGERQYGDLIRIDNDASFGTWFHLSGVPPDLAAGVVAVGQPVPRVHRVLRHLRSGPDDPRRRPVDHAVVRQRRRAPERDQSLHDGRSRDRHHRHGRHDRQQRARVPEPRGAGAADGRTRRQAGLQQQPRIRLRPHEPGPRALDRPAARRSLGGGVVQPGRRSEHRTKSIDFAPSSASPVRPPCAISGRTRTWDR